MYKKTLTGLTGLEVHKNPYHVLSTLYYQIHKFLQKFPDESCYKHHTIEIVCKRSEILEKYKKDMCEVERQMNSGQLEEVVLQAKREYRLAQKMLECRVWEPLIQKPPEDQWTWPPVKST